MEEFERCCHENMTHAVETEEGLGIEYDEDVVCDVCQSPDGEDNNEMVFCDKCNICVHQVRGQHRLIFRQNGFVNLFVKYKLKVNWSTT